MKRQKREPRERRFFTVECSLKKDLRTPIDANRINPSATSRDRASGVHAIIRDVCTLLLKLPGRAIRKDRPAWIHILRDGDEPVVARLDKAQGPRRSDRKSQTKSGAASQTTSIKLHVLLLPVALKTPQARNIPVPWMSVTDSQRPDNRRTPDPSAGSSGIPYSGPPEDTGQSCRRECRSGNQK